MDWLWWLGGAFALGLVEILVLDPTVLMLIGGTLAGAGAAALGVPPPWLQVVVAGVTSVGLVFLAKPWATRLLNAKTPGLPIGVDNYLGKTAQTQTELTAQGGRIKLLGEVWTARLADPTNGINPPPAVPAGADVVVIAIDGATAVVMPTNTFTNHNSFTIEGGE